MPDGHAEHHQRSRKERDVRRRLPAGRDAVEMVEDGSGGGEAAEPDDGQGERIGAPQGGRCADRDSEEEDRDRPGQLGGGEVGERHDAEPTTGRLRHSEAMSAVLPLAHLGHWYLWIPYIIPVIVVLAASLHAFRQQRREDRDTETPGESRP
jgi:hypothetical protein